MAIDFKIRNEKVQYDIKGKAVKIKTHKYQYLTGKEI